MTQDRGIWPGLAYDDPHAAREWLRQIGFEDGIVVPGSQEGQVDHSEMHWPEGGRVMVHSVLPGKDLSSPTGAGNCYVVTSDPDAVHERALALGATVVRPLEETDYGSRGFSVRDPEGNAWSFGTYAGS
jgi:uncharacterized glyoxalase superfamily protein PhnB